MALRLLRAAIIAYLLFLIKKALLAYKAALPDQKERFLPATYQPSFLATAMTLLERATLILCLF